MLQDVEFFSSRLGKIDGFGDAGDFLTNIANSKEVKPKTPPPEPAKETEDSENKDEPEEAKKTDDDANVDAKEDMATQASSKDEDASKEESKKSSDE